MKSARLVIAFFHARMEDSCVAAQAVLASRSIPARWRDLPPAQGLDAVLHELPARDGAPGGLFFSSPECDAWTGFVSRMDDGWYTLVNAMTRNHSQLEALFISADLADSHHPSTAFEFFRGGASVRRVHAWKEDDGWHFVNRGIPLPFEDTSRYSQRLIGERLTLAILDEMSAKLGIKLAALRAAGDLTAARVLAT